MKSVFSWLRAIFGSAVVSANNSVAIRARLEFLIEQQEIASQTRDRQFAALLAKLIEILAALRPGPAVEIVFDVFDMAGNSIAKEVNDMVLNRHNQVRVTGVPKDADGNVTTLDGKPTLTSDNPAVEIADVSDDGLSFTLRAGALAGTGPVSLQGDADLDPNNVVPITGKLDVTVPPGNAITIDLSVGAEEAVPVP